MPQGTSKNYLEYVGLPEAQDPQQGVGGSLNRVLNHLGHYKDLKTPLIVSYDPLQKVKEDHIIREYHWKIPNLRPQDMVRKLQIRRLQGRNKTWFCGTDTTYTGHEGAILSGLVLANALGAPYPFANNEWAKIQFGVVKSIMGIYSGTERVSEWVGNSVYKTAKFLGLNKSQVSKVLLDMYA